MPAFKLWNVRCDYFSHPPASETPCAFIALSSHRPEFGNISLTVRRKRNESAQKAFELLPLDRARNRDLIFKNSSQPEVLTIAESRPARRKS